MARWSPQPGLLAVGWGTALVAAGLAVLSATNGDRPGALLLGLVALATAGFAAQATFVRPKLVADRDGLTVRTVGGTRRLAWSDVQLRLTTTRRLGRDLATIELEAADYLAVLGRLELGADPRDVHEELLGLRPG